jgi:D-methionine transport system substrate-binding protein
LKVIATPTPQAEILGSVKPMLKEQGIDLIVIITDDYNMPNRAVAGGEADANFFQHQPFLDEQIQQFGYPLESIASIEIEPMGIYSKQYKDLLSLPRNAKIAIPNDPTNEGRALRLLQAQGLIELDDPDNLLVTVRNIISNPNELQFVEVDAAMTPRALDDVAAAAINTNYALAARLSPQKDAIVLEDPNSPYANILVVQTQNKDRPDIAALKAALTSERAKQFIENNYKGAVLPAF